MHIPAFAGWTSFGDCPAPRSCKLPPGILMVCSDAENHQGGQKTLRAGLYKAIALSTCSISIEVDTMYWCERNPIDNRCASPVPVRQQQKATWCSNQTDILNHIDCMDWCQQNPGKCDKAFWKVCMIPSNQQKPECACFLPPEFYERITEKLRLLNPESAVIRPICSYSRCAQSPIQPAIREQCPNININNAHCSLVVDNKGTINTDIMNMDIECRVEGDGNAGAASDVLRDQKQTSKGESATNTGGQSRDEKFGWKVAAVVLGCLILLVCVAGVIWYTQ